MDLQIFGGGGAGSGKKSGGGGNEQETYVRGVPQSQIDQLRGTRGHLGEHKLTPDVIKEDYAKVGIKISQSEAEQIHDALHDFTDLGYSYMRDAYRKQLAGKSLSSFEKEDLFNYKMCMEYLKIAPTYQPTLGQFYLYRGIDDSNKQYLAKMRKLKPGDKWDVDKMPTSFSTNITTARKFAGFNKGIIISMPMTKLKNSASIKGLSANFGEAEVLVGDYKWKVVSTSTLGKHLHIVLEPDV